MTTGRGTGPGELPSEALAAAEEDLVRVRQVLRSAARGEAGSEELKRTVQGYLDEHGPALHEAVSALGEEARRQTLQELYKWRAQLAAQLEEQKRRKPSSLASDRLPEGQPGHSAVDASGRDRQQLGGGSR